MRGDRSGQMEVVGSLPCGLSVFQQDFELLLLNIAFLVDDCALEAAKRDFASFQLSFFETTSSFFSYFSQ